MQPAAPSSDISIGIWVPDGKPSHLDVPWLLQEQQTNDDAKQAVRLRTKPVQKIHIFLPAYYCGGTIALPGGGRRGQRTAR